MRVRRGKTRRKNAACAFTAQFRKEKGLPEEDRISCPPKTSLSMIPSEIEPGLKVPARKRAPSAMSSDPARQAILRSRPGMNKPIFGKCLYPWPGYTKKKSASKLTPFRKK